MSGLSFADVVDDSILVYVEDHQAFSDWITERTGGGSSEISLDLAKQQITYLPRLHKRDEVVAPVHLIGTVADQPRSAMWAWANPHFADSAISRMSERVREFGESRGIVEFTTPELPVPADNPGDDRLAEVATTMAAVSCRITGIPNAQIMTGGGTRVVLLVDAAGFTAPPPSAARFPLILTTAIGAAGWVHDHRRAAQGYAQARNLPYGWEPGFSALNIGFPEGNVRVAFDEGGRVSDVRATMGPPQAPQAPQGPQGTPHPPQPPQGPPTGG